MPPHESTHISSGQSEQGSTTNLNQSNEGFSFAEYLAAQMNPPRQRSNSQQSQTSNLSKELLCRQAINYSFLVEKIRNVDTISVQKF